MRWAVLVRAANVGNNVFRPSALVTRLPALELTNLGAAGTFAARSGTSAGAVRKAIAAELPFVTDVFVERADRWHAYVAAHASDPAPPNGARRYLALTARPVENDRRLPLHFPDANGWGVTIAAIEGTFVTGLYRRLEPRILYPNAVVEKRFGVSATTRWWETVVALDAALAVGASGGRREAGRARASASRAARGRARRRSG